MAAGDNFSVALKSDGTVWTWGSNSNAQLGDGTSTQRTSPVEVKATSSTYFSGVVAISTGRTTTYAIKSDGTLWAWGNNPNGQIGDGTTTQRYYPVQTSSLTNVINVSAGGSHVLALESDGSVWAWGQNSSGQLGDGTTTQRTTPVAVSGLGAGSGVAEVTAGYQHSLAWKSDGTVWGWGQNSTGNLGDGTTTSRLTPIQIASFNTVIDVVASYNSLAIKSNGTAWSWGNNVDGQMGNGRLLDYHSPGQMTGMSGAISLGIGIIGYRSMITKNDGTLWVCGKNDYGMLGDGASTQYYSPTQVLSTGTSTIGIACGSAHSLFLKSDGTVWGSGGNTYASVGDGTNFERSIPVQATGLSSIVAVAGGASHSLALKSNGTVWAWTSNNSMGSVGDGTTTARYSAVQVSTLTGITAISAGYYDNMALKSDGTVWTWGLNTNGELGTGTTTNQTSPVQVSSLSGITAVSCGYYHDLALKSDGTVWAWGDNSKGEIGDGTTTARTTPVQVSSLTGIVGISAGYYFNLALKSDGTVWAWGDNSSAQLGDGTFTQRTTPVQVSGLSGIIAVEASQGGASGTFGLALKNDGTVWGWGYNTNGELADGTATQRSTPVQVSGLNGVVAIAAGGNHSLALKQDGSVQSWGSNLFGQMGVGTSYGILFPIVGFNVSPLVTIPSVSITSPSSTGTVTLGQTQTLTASASETGGTIASVSYYVDTTLIGTSTSSGSNYSVSWTPPTWGNFSVTAIAADTLSQTSYHSALVTVQVPYDRDGNGLPDWWELKYLGSVSTAQVPIPTVMVRRIYKNIS